MPKINLDALFDCNHQSKRSSSLANLFGNPIDKSCPFCEAKFMEMDALQVHTSTQCVTTQSDSGTNKVQQSQVSDHVANDRNVNKSKLVDYELNEPS